MRMRIGLSIVALLLGGCVDQPTAPSEPSPETDEVLSIRAISAFDWVSPQVFDGQEIINVPAPGTHDLMPLQMNGHVEPNADPVPAIAVTAKNGTALSRGDRSRAYEAARQWCWARGKQSVGHSGGFAVFARPSEREEPGWIFPPCAPPEKSTD